ncbi:MAG: response regulator transcription factor [Verrucomicrobiota bacterium]|nr:response regulator transcription factor [Verrucomicrobiota bacterium]
MLIVHRSPIMRLGLAAALRDTSRFAVVAETDATADACELLSREQPALLLLGLTLRGGDGLGLLATARRLSPKTKAVVLTARSDMASLQRAFRAGARGYVLVQEQPAVLVQALDEVLRGGVYASADASEWVMHGMAETALETRGAAVERLTNRELLIFRRLGEGEGPAHLARALHLSVKTVETHQARIRLKLQCRSGAELKAFARRWLIASSARDVM